MGPLVFIWLALGFVTLGLALYRKLLTMREETVAHSGSLHQRRIGQQLTLYRRLGTVDRWGSNLAIATGLLGMLLLAIYTLRA